MATRAMTQQATEQRNITGRPDDAGRASGMPWGARAGLLGLVAVLLLGALYLIAVRGEALLVDLSKLGAALCL